MKRVLILVLLLAVISMVVGSGILGSQTHVEIHPGVDVTTSIPTQP